MQNVIISQLTLLFVIFALKIKDFILNIDLANYVDKKVDFILIQRNKNKNITLESTA